MPMFRQFVPSAIRPWIYLFIAFTFQLSGGVYLGSLSHIIGGTALMREDILMCLFSNLAGMAVYFPLLFRMKFRFTNKTLLTCAASGVLLCNLAAPHITVLPLLWAVCFIGGMCKIQGTFECMSNIQLWMTPTRDFTVFFPWLHIVILSSMSLSDIITTYIAYYYNWEMMHLFIVGLMLIVLIIQTACVRHTRIMRKFPLYGIDWTGALLWSALLLQIAYLFNYGDYLDWWNSKTLQILTAMIIVTTIFNVWRMMTIRHPYIDPKIWSYRNYLPLLALIALVEASLATEHVLEELFYEEVMHYGDLVTLTPEWITLIGAVSGCLFSYWWMHMRRYNYLRLLTLGVAVLSLYQIGFYLTISSEIHISQLFLPIFCRGFAYAVLSATFMVCLEEIMTFQHFFQSLGVFNMVHMVVGGVVGSALYARGLSYYIPDNMARYGAAVDNSSFSAAPFDLGHYIEPFVQQMMQVSVKQIYGWVAYATITLLLLFLLYDMPVRQRLKTMPSWKTVAKEVRQGFRRFVTRSN